MNEANNVSVEGLSALNGRTQTVVQHIGDSDYVLAHRDAVDMVYGGLVNEDGLEVVQIMVDGEAARFDPDTLEYEYVSA